MSRAPQTAGQTYATVPILAVTMVENEHRALSDAFRAKPIDRDWLLGTLGRLIRERPQETLLVIDDDEVSRYLLRGLLADTRFSLTEAADGARGCSWLAMSSRRGSSWTWRCLAWTASPC